MKREHGISTVGVALITALVIGGGAGAFAWYQQQNLVQVRGELAEAKVQLDTANKSANTARSQLAETRKELDVQKIAADQLRAERDSAKNLFEAEKQHSERIQAELTQARAQIVALSQRPAYARPTMGQPQVVQPQVLRIAPAPNRGVQAVQSQRAAPPQ